MTVPVGQVSGAEHPAAPPGSRQAHRDASERDKRARRFLLRLSLINWGIAVVAWSISAFLGITSPASIIVYSVLFVIGLLAVMVALLTYLLEKFAHRPPDYEHADLEDHGDETAVAATAGAGGTAAGKTDVPAAAKAEPPAAPKADLPEGKPSASAAEAKPAAPASTRKPADAPRGGSAKGDGKAAADGDAPAAPKG